MTSQKFKKWFWRICPYLYVAFVIGCCSFYWSIKDKKATIEVKDIAAIFVAGTTLYFAMQNLRRENNTFTEHLFTAFNKRYDDLNEEMNGIDSPTYKPKLGKEYRTPEDIVYDYLNLCSEEYYWHMEGHIPDLIWRNWKEGMLGYFKKETVHRIFKEEADNANKNSYYGFLEHMKGKI